MANNLTAPMTSQKNPRGVYTTEFWLTILTVVSASVLAAIGVLDADQWVLVATGSSGAYAVSRGLAK